MTTIWKGYVYIVDEELIEGADVEPLGCKLSSKPVLDIRRRDLA
jgi:hypothetical protein